MSHRKNKKSHKPPKSLHAFPVTRSKSSPLTQDSNVTSSQEEDDTASQNGGSDKEEGPSEGSDSDSKEVQEQKYRRLGLKHLKDLKMDVNNYCPYQFPYLMNPSTL